jgi:RNA polymerase sigma-70 factor (ECF subfamily)
MWQEHEKFELGTNFVSWLSVIAYHQVQKFWRQKKRSRKFLDQSLLEQIAESMPANIELDQARRRALTSCLQVLGESDRELVRHRYSDRKISTKKTASDLGRPTGTVYKALTRIRKSLFECVNRKLSAEGMV